jgi:hypothetical protein
MRFLLAALLFAPLPTFAFDPDAEAAAALALARAARERVKAVEPIAVRQGYPVRPQREWWYENKYLKTYPTWVHLTQGQHKGRFPADWLQTLTNAEICSLHTDDHLGVVHWDYVPTKPAQLPTTAYQLPTKPFFVSSGVPRVCPPSSRT